MPSFYVWNGFFPLSASEIASYLEFMSSKNPEYEVFPMVFKKLYLFVLIAFYYVIKFPFIPTVGCLYPKS